MSSAVGARVDLSYYLADRHDIVSQSPSLCAELRFHSCGILTIVRSPGDDLDPWRLRHPRRWTEHFLSWRRFCSLENDRVVESSPACMRDIVAHACGGRATQSVTFRRGLDWSGHRKPPWFSRSGPERSDSRRAYPEMHRTATVVVDVLFACARDSEGTFVTRSVCFRVGCVELVSGLVWSAVWCLCNSVCCFCVFSVTLYVTCLVCDSCATIDGFVCDSCATTTPKCTGQNRERVDVFSERRYNCPWLPTESPQPHASNRRSVAVSESSLSRRIVSQP